jgi:uncharacterized damage-inducible protein DinB
VDFLHQCRFLARSNTLWNQNLCKELNECGSLGDACVNGIHRVLCHMLAADQIWLSRFAEDDPDLATLEAKPRGEHIEEFWFHRLSLDQKIESTIAAYTRFDLLNVLYYRAFDGHVRHDVLGTCLARMFNHQAHHQLRIGLCSPSWSSLTEREERDCQEFF